jgi:hypothetical protein
VLPREQLGPILEENAPGFAGGELTPFDQLRIDDTSERLCLALATADAARAPEKRAFLSALPPDRQARIDRAAATRLVAPLHQAIYGAAPGKAELAMASAALTDARAHGAGWADAWATLCASYISGPRLLSNGYLGAPR